MSLGKCSCCSGDAVVQYPLLDRAPSFCSAHHNERDAGRFGCDFSPSDNEPDFDDRHYRDTDPVEDGYWHTKDGQEIRYRDMESSHLANAFRYVVRRLKNEGDRSELLADLGALAYEMERRKSLPVAVRLPMSTDEWLKEF